MKRSIWIKESETLLAELGFRPTSVAVARKINGTFTMASGYSVPETDVAEVVELLSESNVLYEVEQHGA
jgi:hypothetical protein